MELYSNLFVFSDQPTTCPLCGARTEIIIDMSHTIYGSQVEECLGCEYQFVVQAE